MSYEVFICYSSQDKAVADAVCATLERIGLRCWIAPRDVPAGKWGGAIMEAVAQSRLMVLIFSADSNNSANCLSEVHAAFSKRDTIIPFKIDNTTPSGDMEYYLQTYHWLDARTPPLEMHLQGLADRVKTDLAHTAAREEAGTRAKKEADEAKKAQETARVKKEAEEAAREKARREAETDRARKEAEVAAEEKARREAEATRIKKEAEEAAQEKAKWEAEAARARQEAEEAKKAREAALKAKKEAEKSRKEKARQEAGAAKAKREAEIIAEKKPTVPVERPVPTVKKVTKSGWFWTGIALLLIGLGLQILVSSQPAMKWAQWQSHPQKLQELRNLYQAISWELLLPLPFIILGVWCTWRCLSHGRVSKRAWLVLAPVFLFLGIGGVFLGGGLFLSPTGSAPDPSSLFINWAGFGVPFILLSIYCFRQGLRLGRSPRPVPVLRDKKISRSGWFWAGVILSLAGLGTALFFALIWSGHFGYPVVQGPWSPLYPHLTWILVFSLPGVIPGVCLIRLSISSYLRNKPVNGRASNWWWLIPVILGLLGGIISWFKFKNLNWRQARNMLTAGILLTFIFISIPDIMIPTEVPPPGPTQLTTTTPSLTLTPMLASTPAITPTPTPTTPVPTTTALTSTPTPTPAPTALTPRYGGTLKDIIPLSPTNLAPSWMPGASIPQNAGVRNPCIETLLRMDEKGNPVPWLATGWNYSADMKSLTFTLKQGVQFHDGTSFNAAAVKYCLDKYRTSTYPELKTVTSIDVVDDYTVRLNLSEFQACFLANFATFPGEIVSPACIQAYDEQWLNNNLAAGTGPFKFVSYQKDVNIKYVRFDGYWQKGKPYLDALETTIITDETAALTAFKAGQAQTIGYTPNIAADLQKEGKYIITGAPSGAFGLAGDSANPGSPFADIRVRQAVAYAIDNEAVAKTAGYGFLQASNQPAIPGSWAFNKDVVGYPYNPQKAKQLLTAAGYPSGFKTRLIYNSISLSTPVSIAFPLIQTYLKAIGIDAELQGVSPDLFQKTCTGGWNNALIQCNITGGMDNDPGKALRDALSVKSGNFVSILHPADYEAMLADSIAQPDFEKRKILTQSAIKMIVDGYCLQNTIFINRPMRASYPAVHDMRRSEVWFNQWTPEDAWIS
jgi:ABC-type transport system substrate-binding protein/uncharacterized membrane protein YfcA